MTPVKLVGFDLDDCLFDSTGLSERARIKGIDAMIDLGLNFEREKAISLIREIVYEYGSNSSQHYDYFMRRLKELKILKNFNKYKYIAAAVMAYHKEKIESISLYNDVEPCLKKLKKYDIKSAIISDGIPIKQYEKILRLNIHNLIDLVVISDEIGIRKPNPKLFTYCLEKFNLTGPETIYVGDNLDKDVVPSNQNDIFSVFIHRGGKYDTYKSGTNIPENKKPDFEITNLMEIFPIIDQLNK
jgi:putative hydrolase of the HAD superfamily